MAVYPLRYTHHWKSAKRAEKAIALRGFEMSAEGWRTSGQKPCFVRRWAMYALLDLSQGQLGAPKEGQGDQGDQ